MEKNRKLQIIHAAVKRFTKPRDLRIGKATIYHYFQSKEELYYATIELRTKEYLEEIRAIFNNGEKPIEDRFIDYFIYKNSLGEKYQLIYELVLLLLKDYNFEPELNALKNLLEKEKELIRDVFNRFNKAKSTPKSDKSNELSLAEFFVIQSWGFMFGQKLNSISKQEESPDIKDMIQKILKNIIVQ
ncbi:MAG: TetR/AcrR family transcriptional regulator [Ignavibacteriaceae bacterium]